MPERKNLKAFVAAHEFNVAMFSVECIMSALIIIGGSIAVNLYIGIDVLSVTASVIAFVLFVISFCERYIKQKGGTNVVALILSIIIYSALYISLSFI